MEQIQNMETLTVEELSMVNGGSIADPIYAVYYGVGSALKSIWSFAETAMDYQSSLPPELKK